MCFGVCDLEPPFSFLVQHNTSWHVFDTMSQNLLQSISLMFQLVASLQMIATDFSNTLAGRW